MGVPNARSMVRMVARPCSSLKLGYVPVRRSRGGPCPSDAAASVSGTGRRLRARVKEFGELPPCAGGTNTGDESSTETAFPITLLFIALCLPSAGAWLFLALASWRCSDVDRLRALENRQAGAVLLDLLSWRTTAHLGPYQVPNLVRAQLQKAPLRALRDPGSSDRERARALARLGRLTERRLAAAAIGIGLGGGGSGTGEGEETSIDGYGSAALHALEPLLLDMFREGTEEEEYKEEDEEEDEQGSAVGAPLCMEPLTPPLSAPPLARRSKRGLLEASPANRRQELEASARILFDVVLATPAVERVVPPWVLSGLVRTAHAPWGSCARGEELRVALLVLLLEAPGNCWTVASSLSEVRHYLQQPGVRLKANTIWPLKAYLLGGETPDLLRRGALLVNMRCPGSIDVPEEIRYERETLSLQAKHDLRNAQTTALLTAGWATVVWLARGPVGARGISSLMRACVCALGSVAVLEGLWRAQERIIETEWYFSESCGTLLCSAGMCVLNCAAWAWALRYSAFLPFAVCRFAKDDIVETFRSFED